MRRQRMQSVSDLLGERHVNAKNGSVKEEVIKFAIALVLMAALVVGFVSYLAWRAENTRRALDMIEAPADQPVKGEVWT